ncbi:MAG: AAA family ATPase [Chlamydiae bacterium CG10_big_fil_rev_8_21_14_0_10_35_9]|nr:MAG: AAA family ATPase [Chlamydiae bacterium CG10_big_fil_rev_8_21_14_0_10_35_9]
MNSKIPLSETLRPDSFDKIYGQNHIIGQNSWLKKSLEKKTPLSLLFYGPPGCGKTTIARLYAKHFDLNFQTVSAVEGSVAEVKKILSSYKNEPLLRQKIILFIDEIHRLNKAQQDLFLPFIENGTLILLGATTENPSFTINNALLSRLRVFTLKPLDTSALLAIINRYEPLSDKKFSQEAKEALIEYSSGDGRYLLNLIENLEVLPEKEIGIKELKASMQTRLANYDKHGDGHYQLISALHKSIRGSDADASLYWLCRMLKGGEDPLFICRRLIRTASEDIGLADPQALVMANETFRSFQILGSPEGELMIAQLVIYLALSPKSNRVYKAFKKASEIAEKTTHFSPPKTLINGSTAWMKKEGYGGGYIYDHDTEKGFSGQNYFPDNMERASFYTPRSIGYEREMEKRLAYFKKMRETI